MCIIHSLYDEKLLFYSFVCGTARCVKKDCVSCTIGILKTRDDEEERRKEKKKEKRFRFFPTY